MGDLSMTMFVTVDGVVQAPGGPDEDRDGGFEHGGWLVPHFDEDLGRFVDGVFRRPEAFLLGRRTYDIFASHWPKIDDPNDLVAAKLNGLPKYVASRTLQQADWSGTTVLRGDLVDEVRRLKARHAGEIQVHGSGSLAQQLLASELVDELRLLVFPVVLGTGKRLFGPGVAPAGLKLVSAPTTAAGVILATYRREGPPTYGAIGLDTE